jgi:hypothetical protein
MLRQARQRGGRYLLPTNLLSGRIRRNWATISSSLRWSRLSRPSKAISPLEPIFHQHKARIDAHIFIAFLAYALHVTLARRLAALAPGLTPRSVLDKFTPCR